MGSLGCDICSTGLGAADRMTAELTRQRRKYWMPVVVTVVVVAAVVVVVVVVVVVAAVINIPLLLTSGATFPPTY